MFNTNVNTLRPNYKKKHWITSLLSQNNNRILRKQQFFRAENSFKRLSLLKALYILLIDVNKNYYHLQTISSSLLTYTDLFVNCSCTLYVFVHSANKTANTTIACIQFSFYLSLFVDLGSITQFVEITHLFIT